MDEKRSSLRIKRKLERAASSDYGANEKMSDLIKRSSSFTGDLEDVPVEEVEKAWKRKYKLNSEIVKIDGGKEWKKLGGSGLDFSLDSTNKNLSADKAEDVSMDEIHFQVHEVFGDGYCFYHCLEAQGVAKKKLAKKHLLQWMRFRRNLLEPVAQNLAGCSLKTLEEQISDPNQWAQWTDILLASLCFNIRVFVLSQDSFVLHPGVPMEMFDYIPKELLRHRFPPFPVFLYFHQHKAPLTGTKPDHYALLIPTGNLPFKFVKDWAQALPKMQIQKSRLQLSSL